MEVWDYDSYFSSEADLDKPNSSISGGGQKVLQLLTARYSWLTSHAMTRIKISKWKSLKFELGLTIKRLISAVQSTPLLSVTARLRHSQEWQSELLPLFQCCEWHPQLSLTLTHRSRNLLAKFSELADHFLIWARSEIMWRVFTFEVIRRVVTRHLNYVCQNWCESKHCQK